MTLRAKTLSIMSIDGKSYDYIFMPRDVFENSTVFLVLVSRDWGRWWGDNEWDFLLL